ncbi:hypothetical protein QTP70_018564 [Hemibagrus guttatus]|uniref:Interleukin-1 n=1 Tax=Hemibagrus guttatus TaxID=175788 RepID=A0AAE0QIX7_9TELE|nr:hypothetical protein QTP70_018564 [Hemibagrus guttatus]
MNSFLFNSYFGSDSGFDSDDTDFDELDCSDPLAMSRRCDLHKGIRIESTEFTDQDLFNIFMENVIEAWFNLSAYNPPNCRENTKGQPVCLGIVKSNLFLSCKLQNETPFLSIEEVEDKESLKAIRENDELERFLFLRKGSGDTLNTFESVRYPEMADKDLLMLESYFGSDSGFDSEDTDFDELDCSDPLAMVSHGYRFVKHHLTSTRSFLYTVSKTELTVDSDVSQSSRCDLHKGIRIEVTKEPLSMRSVANIVIAVHRLKHTQRVQSTEFTDQDLFNIFMENVIEESVVIDLKCNESKSYSMQDKIVQCTICDKSKRALVQKEKPPILLAITLKGGNEENKAWFNLSAYNPPNCRENTKGQPVCLGIVKSNLFLSCKLQNETPFLSIEEVEDKESLKAIRENDELERFLFLRKGSGDTPEHLRVSQIPGMVHHHFQGRL